MRKNGFTLIEVLGVVVLLALISSVVLIAIDKSLKDSKNTLSTIQIENIKSAANMWKTDNIESIPDTGYYVLTLGDLIDSGYIGSVVDINTSNNYDRDILVNIGMNDVLVNEEYRKIDYIKSNGNQYINTNYIAKTNTEIQLDIQFIENSNTYIALSGGNITIIGTDALFDSNVFHVNTDSNSGKKLYFWVDKSDSTIYSKNYNVVTNRSIMKVKSGLATFQGENFEIATKTGDNIDKMVLLGGYLDALLPFNRYDSKIYDFKILEGDTLVKDMIPVRRKVDGVVGLYDILNDVFYRSNSGTDFIYEG